MRNSKFRLFERVLVIIVIIFFLGKVPAYASQLADQVIEHTLNNGLKILVLERHQCPTVSLYIRFKVGMVEDRGAGMAHFLEHMLFKGTTTIGTTDYRKEAKLLKQIEIIGEKLDKEKRKGKLADEKRMKELERELATLQKKAGEYVIKDEMNLLYSENGAAGFNASTGADVTTYKVSLPSNRIELWARLESDRMANPVFREFYSERNVVLEERRQTNESEPFRKFLEQFLNTAYIYHPYRNPIIGWKPEIQFLTKADMKKFFHTYYVPNNAVIAAVGDLEAESFIALVEKYFGSIPQGDPPPALSAEEPRQLGERRVSVTLDAQPRLLIGYHKPTLPSDEDYIFDLVDAIFTAGRTSRLYKRLVEDEQLAVQVSTSNGMPGARYANIFTFMATPRHPHTLEEVEQGIYEEIAGLINEPVSDYELQKIKNQLAGDFIRSLKSNAGLASRLSYFDTIAGDWKYIDTHLEVLDKVTPRQIQEAAKKYFTKMNRTVAYLVSETPMEN